MKIQVNAASRLQVANAPLPQVIQFFKHYDVDVERKPKTAKFNFGSERFTSVTALKTPYEDAKAKLTKAFGTPVPVSITTGALRIVRGLQWEVAQGTVLIFASEAKLSSGKTRPNIAVLLDEPWKKK